MGKENGCGKSEIYMVNQGTVYQGFTEFYNMLPSSQLTNYDIIT